VEPGEARAVLGVAVGATPDQVRVAYRAALRRSHPDLHGGDGDRTRAVVTAYRVLRDEAGTEPEPEPGSEPGAASEAPAAPADVAVVVDGDTVAADLPAGDLFTMLLEVGERIGEVSYADPAAGLLEVVVTVADHGACSVVLSLQARAEGLTEAWCTVEPLGTGPAPPPAAVAALLGDGLRSLR
jgi:hypothetical protein